MLRGSILCAAVASLVVLAGGAAGCGDDLRQSCISIGCDYYGFDVVIDRPSGFNAGTWTVYVIFGTTKISCDLVVPAQGTDTANGKCTGDAFISKRSDGRLLARIGVLDIPSVVQVSVLYEGQFVANQTPQPGYSTYQPAGPNCVTCTRRTFAMTIAPP